MLVLETKGEQRIPGRVAALTCEFRLHYKLSHLDEAVHHGVRKFCLECCRQTWKVAVGLFCVYHTAK